MEVGMDMAVIGPFLCLPIAYMVKTAFTDELTVENVKLGLEKYVEDVKFRGLLFKYWAVWIPAQSLTFSVIPEHFRILFVAAISFFWMFILSSTSAATNDPSADA
jgi:protein Mpv17